jgi:hypothetical protein
MNTNIFYNKVFIENIEKYKDLINKLRNNTNI